MIKTRKKNLLRILILFFVLTSCSSVAVITAPSKKSTQTRTRHAELASQEFLSVFHEGKYDELSHVMERLTAAYLQTPTDSVTAAHLGFAHIWYVAERERLETVPATMTNHATLARKYFEEATRLNPSEDRYLGFLGASLLAEATIHQDEKQKRKGYFTLHESIKRWPEFNLFTGGYVMSRLPFDSEHFIEALEWQWRTLDECAETKIDRKNPDFSPYLSLKTTQGRKRVCWNSWLAPHNFEGFFMNMGDMLVKAGDLETARKIYTNAKLSETYPQWKYKEELERRIAEMNLNVPAFRAEPTRMNRDRRMMFNSKISCVACHQN